MATIINIVIIFIQRDLKSFIFSSESLIKTLLIDLIKDGNGGPITEFSDNINCYLKR